MQYLTNSATMSGPQQQSNEGFSDVRLKGMLLSAQNNRSGRPGGHRQRPLPHIQKPASKRSPSAMSAINLRGKDAEARGRGHEMQLVVCASKAVGGAREGVGVGAGGRPCTLAATPFSSCAASRAGFRHGLATSHPPTLILSPLTGQQEGGASDTLTLPHPHTPTPSSNPHSQASSQSSECSHGQACPAHALLVRPLLVGGPHRHHRGAGAVGWGRSWVACEGGGV